MSHGSRYLKMNCNYKDNYQDNTRRLTVGEFDKISPEIAPNAERNFVNIYT